MYCPICKSHFDSSEYLATIFEVRKQRWLANMVTHYRHRHITSWNKCWNQYGRHYRGEWFGNYEEEKAKVNERAKRQIIRKATDFLLYHEFTIGDFLALQGTENETIELAKKKLLGAKH